MRQKNRHTDTHSIQYTNTNSETYGARRVRTNIEKNDSAIGFWGLTIIEIEMW